MDQALELKLKKFQKSLLTLEEAINAEENDLKQDAIIKRFEYNFELCWKIVKIFLNKQFGVDIFSPKGCFRELRKNKLFSDGETEIFLKMIDDRNEVIHTYNEDFAKELCQKIKKDYFGLLKKVYDLIN